MKFFKKLVSAAVLSLVLVPAQFVQAASTLDDSASTVINNMMEAESIDFSADLEIETDNDQLAQPVKLHVDFDGASNYQDTAQFDVGFWSTDANGAFSEFNGSLMLADNTAYFSTGDEWYFYNLTSAIEPRDEADVAAQAAALEIMLQDFLDQGVITSEMETVEFVNGKMAVRYGYALDNDKAVDYLVLRGYASEDEADDLREMLSDNITVGGQVWVDPVAMLPVMWTLNVNAVSSETTYTNMTYSVVFNSFNEPIEVDVPTNAIDAEEFFADDSAQLMMASVEQTLEQMDTDGDGLSDTEEKSTWNSNPLSVDTDGDGYLDKTEVINGYNPNGVGKLDSDHDGLTDYNEMTIHWSDRYNADTDGDSYPDGVEIANGYDPNGPGRF